MITVLVVDDDASNRNQFVAFVRAQGYACEGCTYAEAISQLAEFRPPVIMLAVVNETVSEALFKQLTDYSVEHEKFPVIAVSMSGTMALEQWIAGGASDYLLEPYHAAALKLRIEANVERWQGDVYTKYFRHLPFEMRGMITSIKGYTDILHQTLTTQKYVVEEKKRIEFLAKVIWLADRAMTLLNRFQDSAWVESDTLRLLPKPLEMAKLCREVVESHAQKYLAKQQTIVFDGLDGSVTVLGDYYRICQVIDILLENAIQYTPEHGTITITLNTMPDTNTQKKLIHVAVQDTGFGVQESDFAQIFRWMGHGTDPRVLGLMGWGGNLFVAKGIIELHGGKMWFESVYNEGSTFHFTLPAAEH